MLLQGEPPALTDDLELRVVFQLPKNHGAQLGRAQLPKVHGAGAAPMVRPFPILRERKPRLLPRPGEGELHPKVERRENHVTGGVEEAILNVELSALRNRWVLLQLGYPLQRALVELPHGSV